MLLEGSLTGRRRGPRTRQTSQVNIAEYLLTSLVVLVEQLAACVQPCDVGSKVSHLESTQVQFIKVFTLGC